MKDASGGIAVVVLGMRRSGASSLVGLLAGYGCKGPVARGQTGPASGPDLSGPEPLQQLNEAILASPGSQWDPGARGCREGALEDWFLDRAKRILVEDYGDAPLICLEDQSLCRVFPLWDRALTEAGYAVRVVHVHRDPAEEASAIDGPGGKLSPLVYPVWLRHVIEAERDSRERRRFFTSRDAILGDPDGVMERMGAALGIEWPDRPVDESDSIDHQAGREESGTDESPVNGAAPEMVRTTLSILEAWARDGERAEDHAALDAMHEVFERAADLFSAPIRALEARIAEEAGDAVEPPAPPEGDRPPSEQAVQVSPQALPEGEVDKDRTIADLTAEVNLLADKLIARDKVLNKIRADSAAAFAYAERMEKTVEARGLWPFPRPVKAKDRTAGGPRRRWLHGARQSGLGRKLSRLNRRLRGRK